MTSPAESAAATTADAVITTTTTPVAVPPPGGAGGSDFIDSVWQKLIDKRPVRTSEARNEFAQINVDMHEAVVRAFADDAQEEPPLPIYNAVVQEAYKVMKKVHRKNAQYAWMRPSHPIVQASARRLEFLQEMRKRTIDLL